LRELAGGAGARADTRNSLQDAAAPCADSGGSECRSYFVPAEKIERLVLQGVAERLAQRMAAADAQAYIGQVARRVLI
jgi:hypothetical protein